MKPWSRTSKLHRRRFANNSYCDVCCLKYWVKSNTCSPSAYSKIRVVHFTAFTHFHELQPFHLYGRTNTFIGTPNATLVDSYGGEGCHFNSKRFTVYGQMYGNILTRTIYFVAIQYTCKSELRLRRKFVIMYDSSMICLRRDSFGCCSFIELNSAQVID